MTWRLKVVVLGAAVSLVPATMLAQTQTRRASIRGNAGDEGKCTIEVEVDGSAEVELFGDTGRIRNLSGSPATWRRLECNGAMPRNPTDFRFKGIDGRGHVALVGDPGSNGGIAVVRIDDSKGGREGYTFDLIWRGGYGNSGGSYSRDGYRDRDRDRDRDNRDRYRDDYRDRDSRDRNRDGYGDRGYSSGACQQAVRDRATKDYGLREITFQQSGYEQGRRDLVVGTFLLRRNNRSDEFRYSCTVDSNGGIRSVNISPTRR